MQRPPARPHGFSMVELLVVIVIIGIIAAIAVPLYLAQRSKAKDAAVKEGVHSLVIGLAAYAADHGGALPPTGDLRVLKGTYVDHWPVDPFDGGEMTYSSTPVPGAYDYVLGATSYSLTGWLHAGDFQVTGAAGSSYASGADAGAPAGGGSGTSSGGGASGAPSATPSADPTPSVQPSASPSASTTPSATPSATPTGTGGPEPTVQPSPTTDADSFAAVAGDLVSRLQDYHKGHKRWPSPRSGHPYTDLGLDPAAYDSPIGGVQYELTGSQILAWPASDRVIAVSDKRGNKRRLEARDDACIIYDGDNDAWYFGSVRSGDQLDISTLTVAQT